MRLEISGKGVVCNVYYIEKHKFNEISRRASEVGPAIKELLMLDSDFIINVSRGFFADSNVYDFCIRFASGDVISKQYFEENIFQEIDHESLDSDDSSQSGYLSIFHANREKDISETQVCIVEYHQFDFGTASIELDRDSMEDLRTFNFLCESVDRAGPSGQEDLATKATYHDGVVATEDLQYAEYAINGVSLAGKDYFLSEAKFEEAHSRVWLWAYDPELGEHALDFLGSKTLLDPWTIVKTDLELNDINSNFDLDLENFDKIKKFFNQQDLDWFNENRDYVKRYQISHSLLGGLFSSPIREPETPIFATGFEKAGTCTLICMLFDAFGISGYDPIKMAGLDKISLRAINFETLALGNVRLLTAVKQSFCMHFGVISSIGAEGEFFPQIINPSLEDAINFTTDIVNDPDSSFNKL